MADYRALERQVTETLRLDRRPAEEHEPERSS